jgi:hypothetical protein
LIQNKKAESDKRQIPLTQVEKDINDKTILLYIEINGIKHYLMSNSHNIHNENIQIYYQKAIPLSDYTDNNITNYIWLVKQNQNDNSTYFICTNNEVLDIENKLQHLKDKYEKNKNNQIKNRLFLNIEDNGNIKLWHLGQSSNNHQLFTFHDAQILKNNTPVYYIDSDDLKYQIKWEEYTETKKKEILSYVDKIKRDKQKEKDKFKNKHLEGLKKEFEIFLNNILFNKDISYTENDQKRIEKKIKDIMKEINEIKEYNEQGLLKFPKNIIEKIQNNLKSALSDKNKLIKFILCQQILQKLNQFFTLNNNDLVIQKVYNIFDDHVKSNILNVKFILKKSDTKFLYYKINYEYLQEPLIEVDINVDNEYNIQDYLFEVIKDEEEFYIKNGKYYVNDRIRLDEKLNNVYLTGTIETQVIENQSFNNFNFQTDEYGNVLACIKDKSMLIEVYNSNIHRKYELKDFVPPEQKEVYILYFDFNNNNTICYDKKSGEFIEKSTSEIIRNKSLKLENNIDCFFFSEKEDKKFYLYTFIDYKKSYVYYKIKSEKDAEIILKNNKTDFIIKNNILKYSKEGKDELVYNITSYKDHKNEEQVYTFSIYIKKVL